MFSLLLSTNLQKFLLKLAKNENIRQVADYFSITLSIETKRAAPEATR
jgi:hypothetical protein